MQVCIVHARTLRRLSHLPFTWKASRAVGCLPQDHRMRWCWFKRGARRAPGVYCDLPVNLVPEALPSRRHFSMVLTPALTFSSSLPPIWKNYTPLLSLRWSPWGDQRLRSSGNKHFNLLHRLERLYPDFRRKWAIKKFTPISRHRKMCPQLQGIRSSLIKRHT